MTELLDKMAQAKQLSVSDGQLLSNLCRKGDLATPESEEDVLRWLAGEYEVPFNDLEGIEPDKALLAQFPARVLLKEELLPLSRANGSVRIATSRRFSTASRSIVDEERSFFHSRAFVFAENVPVRGSAFFVTAAN